MLRQRRLSGGPGGLFGKAPATVQGALRLRQLQTVVEGERERRIGVAEALRELLAALNSNRSLAEILDFALDQAITLLRSQAGVVYLFDAQLDDGYLYKTATRGLVADHHIAPRLRVGTPISGLAVKVRRPVAMNNLPTAMVQLVAPGGGPRIDDRGSHLVISGLGAPAGSSEIQRVRGLADAYAAALAVPLLARDEVYGSLTLLYREPSEFSDEDVDLTTAFGHQAALAIGNARMRDATEQRLRESEVLAAENARLHQEASLRARELEALYWADARMHTSLRLDDVLNALVEVAVNILQADIVSVLVWDTARERYVIGAAHGMSVEGMSTSLGADEEIVRATLSSDVLAVEDVTSDPRLSAQLRELAAHEAIRASLAAPIRVGTDPLGVFSMSYLRVRTFDDREKRLLRALADRAALALENAKLYEQAQERAREVEALYRADEQMHSSLHLQTVLEALVDVASDLLHGDQTSVMCWDPQRSRQGVGALRGTTTRPQLAMAAPELGALVCKAFSSSEKRLVRSLAQRASLAVQNARLYEQAQYAATLEERQRLARELHDAVTQSLFSASLIAEIVPTALERNPTAALEHLAELRRLTRGALAEMRALLVELRPGALTELALGDLLRQLGAAAMGRTRLEVCVSVFDAGSPRLPENVQVNLYRIAQEALSNVGKHARASQAEVQLRHQATGALHLRISDDGRGFDPRAIPAGHLGVGIMRERAESIGARLRVTSRPQAGTRIDVVWKPAT